ncbi:ARMT1-like domain-containing protein [Desulfonatronovibrio hydrogenovorans]|uniref:ARMT1-like domain-containing protein n=1 Tax=Desulfonatronovibrio hydrogenovorans TaxID=53245 RepID=UPI00048B67AB|nr:ARMT1-like domain-containing protein [Desulfonatronovibrio hydrogenovorans]
MSKLPNISSSSGIHTGRDPYLDAWLLHFMLENNIEHLVNPKVNASAEQLRFMVDLKENQVFAPCTDWMFDNLLKGRMTRELKDEYIENWKRVVSLIHSSSGETYVRKKVVSLCKHLFQKALYSPFMIPSRLLKRMLDIFLSQNALQDPYLEEKSRCNRRALEFMNTHVFYRFISSCPDSTMGCEKIQDLRWELDLMELRRFFCLSTWSEIWNQDDFSPGSTLVEKEIGRQWDGFETVMTDLFGPDNVYSYKILYLPDSAGGIMFDLKIIQALIRLGHKVVLALKEGFYFKYPTLWDLDGDPVLAGALNEASLVQDSQISKKDFLKKQRENRLLVISDGTRERMNLYRTSITFARAWKESDLVIAKGNGNFRRLIQNSYLFTRDILAFYRDEQGEVHFRFKKKSPEVRKFIEKEIVIKAEEIKKSMLRARMEGQRVLFYSAIIGSIPGQTSTAIEVINQFVSYMRERMDQTFIVNPAEHFEHGMDGDDLMFMWEMVQRSGLIDVWRFQSVADIEKSFELMGKKVPPIWAGKDATYSTGCTKEMHIALEVQTKNPEMQIIGPSPEKFFRRREYGVGKFFDANIERENGRVTSYGI